MTRSARAIRAEHSTHEFPSGVRKTLNNPQCPRVQGGTLDANGVKLNYLKFGNSAVRPSAADPFCGSLWATSWGFAGPGGGTRFT